VLEGVARIKPDCRVLVVGSSEQYGKVSPDELPIGEETPFRPLSAYATSKIAQDLLGLQYHLTHGLHVVRARPFNHIGPGQRIGFVAPDFASQIAAIEQGLQPPLIEVGNLAARRDFTDVRDVVRAYVALITQGQPGQVYNIGSGRSHSIQEVLDLLLSLSPFSIEIKQDPKRMRPSEVPEVICDAARIQSDTGWQPEIPFHESLREILDYWRERLVQDAGSR